MGLKMKDIKGMSAEARKGKIQELKLKVEKMIRPIRLNRRK